MKVLLCCGIGASTSLVAGSMMDSINSEERHLYKVDAISFHNIKEKYKEYDVILLAPQIFYKFKELSKLAGEANIPIAMIDAREYGMVQGDKIMKQAVSLYENK